MKPGEYPDFFRLPPPAGASRESGIRLDREGHFWHNDERVGHPKLSDALHSWITRHPDNGRYILTNGYDWVYFTVENTPYIVQKIETDASGSALMLTLSDASVVPLKPESLTLGADGALYATVHVKRGVFSCRFSRYAQTQLEPFLVEDETGGVGIRIGEEIYFPPPRSLSCIERGFPMSSDHRTRTDYAQARHAWEASVLTKAPQGAPARTSPGLYAGGSDVADLYGPDDLERVGFDPVESVGFPGEAPYTRGVQPTMYRGRLWTMRQYAGFGTAEESNRRYHYLLQQGQTGLSIAFDLPTQMGRDSDHPLARGEVGKVGVAINSLEDMRILLRGIPLNKVSTSMTINATAAILLCLYIAVAEENGTPRAQLRGTIQNDILKEYVARGTYIYPPGPSLRLIRDIFAFAQNEIPHWNTISISGYHMREAGCDAAQEIAFTLGNAITYVQTAVDSGLSVDVFGAQLSFFFNGHNNLLEEVAKFRAARRMWCHIMESRFAAQNPKAKALRFHTQTAGMSLQAQQPLNNVVRVAIQAIAAILGGTQSLHTNSYDEALGLPTTESATLALRTQQVIAYESGLADFIDPFAGSYAIESLTSELEERANAYLKRIDDMGGMIAAIESGYVQREIQASAYQYQLDIEHKRRVIVGLNEFTGEAAEVPVMQIDPSVENAQIQRVRSVRSRRDATRWQRAITQVQEAARTDTNLIPLILEAVKAEATVGEISDALRDIFGEYQEAFTL